MASLPDFSRPYLSINFHGLPFHRISLFYESRGGTSDFRLPTSDFRLPTSDFRLPTSDFRLPTSDFREREDADDASPLITSLICAMKRRESPAVLESIDAPLQHILADCFKYEIEHRPRAIDIVNALLQ